MNRLTPLAGLALLVVVAGCAPSHRLAEVQLQGSTVAVMAPIPPAERIVVGPWPHLDQGIRAARGEQRRRFDAAWEARNRLDLAAEHVDVIELMAARALAETARTLRFHPADDPDASDFILDVRLLEFRFIARSFGAPVRLASDLDVVLSDRRTREVLWQRRMTHTLNISPEHFGFAPDRRLTPALMTRMSEEDFIFGLEQTAMLVADQITATLRTDYERAHR